MGEEEEGGGGGGVGRRGGEEERGRGGGRGKVGEGRGGGEKNRRECRSDGERSGESKEGRKNFRCQHATNYEVEKRRLLVYYELLTMCTYHRFIMNVMHKRSFTCKTRVF